MALCQSVTNLQPCTTAATHVISISYCESMLVCADHLRQEVMEGLSFDSTIEVAKLEAWQLPEAAIF